MAEHSICQPGGKTDTPGARPIHLPCWIAILPESEIFWRPFILGYLHLDTPMPASTQIFEGIARKRPVASEATHVL